MAKMTKANAIQVLIQHASAQVSHKYAGMCPDTMEGFDKRDPDCPVCQALNALGALQPNKAPKQTNASIQATHIDREALDVRSSGDSRNRVDAYFVSYKCPPDAVNPQAGSHEWVCRFEVPRGEKFEMRDFATKAEAIANRGFTI